VCGFDKRRCESTCSQVLFYLALLSTSSEFLFFAYPNLSSTMATLDQLKVALSEEFTSIINGGKTFLSSSTRSLLSKVLGDGLEHFDTVEKEVRQHLNDADEDFNDADEDLNDYFDFVEDHYTECCGWEACKDENHIIETARHNIKKDDRGSSNDTQNEFTEADFGQSP
jgi:hypothetical protein